MSDSGIVLNLVFEESGPLCKSEKSVGNLKHKRFLGRRHYLERKGLLKEKQNVKWNSLPPKNKKLPLQKKTHIQFSGGDRSKMSNTQLSGGGRSKKSNTQLNGGGQSKKSNTQLSGGDRSKKSNTQLSGGGQSKKSNTQLSGGGRSKKSNTQLSGGAVFPKFTSNLPNKTNKPSPSSSANTSSQKSTFSCPSTASTFQRHPTHQAAPRTLGPLKYVALDCEMVGTGPKGICSELARCSIVNYDGDVLYDKFIKPINPVTDYRTRWSGVRRKDLVNATPFHTAQKEIVKILKGKMVVGHAIHNDFKVIKYFHPNCQTRDTSKIPLLNQKAGQPENITLSLKRLTKAILNQDIQTGNDGHSSVEDAVATMELYKVVEKTWEQKLRALSLSDKAMDLAQNQK
ncbi:interferon-stimulated 20 kDa exonuclease-like 2 [Megalobrama amblycephala]|uniref:interferon-stimulated 20 kDa exonuclease-like 2 n=1 Tax=Megalobrama amblycephala TaxID=75352 RepID=UPI002014634F|nr:interferon-stimulated 20 kDa exonuclease-like 2 [Megalobrama amblycephala]XP_048009508.1 interferon-stimulated 20 kDa exonuclease-like 2 [Megalobrama amblycephala]